MNDPLLRLKDVALGYNANTLYTGVNLTAGEGELVSLLGANGAGKSTLLHCITGQLAPLAGRVEIAGRDITGIPKHRLARLVSIVTTGKEMAGGLTVNELVSLGRQPHTGFFGRLSRRDREIVDEALAAVGMSEFADRMVATLSDGERQKVMIARALAQETPVMALDEPTAFLDVASRLETMQLLARLARTEGKAVIVSTHDVSSALRLSGRLWMIVYNDSRGVGGDCNREIIDGTPREMIKTDALGKLFRGRRVQFSPEAMDFIPSGYGKDL